MGRAIVPTRIRERIVQIDVQRAVMGRVVAVPADMGQAQAFPEPLFLRRRGRRLRAAFGALF